MVAYFIMILKTVDNYVDLTPPGSQASSLDLKILQQAPTPGKHNTIITEFLRLPKQLRTLGAIKKRNKKQRNYSDDQESHFLKKNKLALLGYGNLESQNETYGSAFLPPLPPLGAMLNCETGPHRAGMAKGPR